MTERLYGLDDLIAWSTHADANVRGDLGSVFRQIVSNHIVWITHITRAELANVNEPAVRKANIHKRAKVDHVEHRTPQLHTSLQVFELHHIFAEDRRRQVLARVAPRPAERLDHVVECELSNAQLGR